MTRRRPRTDGSTVGGRARADHAVKRAGADIIITYLAAELAEVLTAVIDFCDADRCPAAGWCRALPRTRAGRQRSGIRAVVASHPGGVSSPVRAFSCGGRHALRRRVRGEGPYVGRRGQRTSTSCRLCALSSGTRTPRRGRRDQSRRPRRHEYGAPTAREMNWRKRSGVRTELRVGATRNSGTEATMTAVRVARGDTRRSKVISSPATITATADSLLARGAAVWRARFVGFGRCPRQRGGGHRGCALQRVARDRRRRCGGDRRAGGGQHGPGRTGARLPGGVARGVRSGGCPPHFRRGHHGLPSRPRGRAGAVRRARRPHLFREGHWWWPSDRRVRGTAADEFWPRSARLPAGTSRDRWDGRAHGPVLLDAAS